MKNCVQVSPIDMPHDPDGINFGEFVHVPSFPTICGWVGGFEGVVVIEDGEAKSVSYFALLVPRSSLKRVPKNTDREITRVALRLLERVPEEDELSAEYYQ